ncbi:MAG TPA: aminotransferase class V-fold PLP-dependent enzyme [Candidatus Eisenbacteria bacterium]|nr:aminotransferase class V-fold PLP-dependent enzyme [Candidatus Eisenbacteria bacterium]
MPEIQLLEQRLGSLEAESLKLDATPDEIQRWLEALSRFSVEYLEANGAAPAFLPLGGPNLAQPLPLRPTPLTDVLEEFKGALGRGIVSTSGRFFGYVPGGGVPTGAVGDFLAALTNRYSGNYGAAPGATAIENDAVRWLIEMVGYPETAWGTLQSGGSLATLTAVVAARESRQAWDWMRSVIYMTEECHLAIRKSLHIAGLAHVPCRTVPVDERLHMSLPDLERMIAEDRSKNLQPWMVFASAGTVNTGAIDPLDEIAKVAKDEGLWMHVDGAYGAFFVLAERARASLEAMALADSVVLDPHKGLFLPYGCGAVLVKHGDLLRQAFTATHSYLSDVEHEEPSPSSYSPELTRHFRALRLWMSLKVHGLERFRAALEEKLLLARLAWERLRAMPRIDPGPEPELSCVAFRVRDDGDGPTREMLDRILERGRVHMSSTVLGGKLYIRICVLCFRSHRADLDEAISEIERATS